MEECKDSFQKKAATPKRRKEKEIKIINETNWDTSTVTRNSELTPAGVMGEKVRRSPTEYDSY